MYDIKKEVFMSFGSYSHPLLFIVKETLIYISIAGDQN